MKNKKLITFAVWLVLVGGFMLLFSYSGNSKPKPFEDFETFRAQAESGEVAEVRMVDGEIAVRLYSGEEYRTYGFFDEKITQTLAMNGVYLQWGEEDSTFDTLLTYGIPVLLVLLAVLFFSRRFGGQTNNILALRRSRARVITDSNKVTFDDVGGCEQAKAVFADVVDFLKHAERWTGAGARLPRGVLLEGPPGCGKTLLARAVAGETNATFYTVSASEFVEMFVGVGAARVRDMFETAARTAPSVIFIDELDAVGRRRGSGIGAGHDEREQTLNQLLVSLDGFERNDRVVVIAASNRPDILDPALLRPGRFDRRIKVPPLSIDDRLAVFKIHTRDKPLAEDVVLEELAEQCPGFSGSQIESLCNEAALLAVRRVRQDSENGAARLSMSDFQEALGEQQARERVFTRLDMALIESASQLTEPTGLIEVVLTLLSGEEVRGTVIWADAVFLKLRMADNGQERIFPKRQVRELRAGELTEHVPRDDVQSDVWAGRLPDMA